LSSEAISSHQKSLTVIRVHQGGIGEKFMYLRHVHAVVDQSIGRSCASESQDKHVNHFAIGVKGNIEGLCGTYML
jgi:hypothetical protein